MFAKKLNALSLFSGAGGLDLGLHAAGVNVLCASDLEDYACATLRENFKSTFVIGPPDHDGNIVNYSPLSFLKKAGLRPNDIHSIVGGPPCQPFSIAANQRFYKGDKRFKRQGYADEVKGGLVEAYLSFVRDIRPACFLMENVPGIYDMDGGETLGRLLKMVYALGYKTTAPTVINSADFGVPQRRRRCIILGLKDKQPPPLPKSSQEIPGFAKANKITVAHALLGIPKNCTSHEVRDHEATSIARYKKLKFGQREPMGRVDRLDPGLPSKTIISGGSNGGGRSHLHPFIARTLTVRESARIQTFPDEHIFFGSIARQFTQVGNAVPPYLAAQLFYFISSQIFKIKSSLPMPPTYLNRGDNVESLCRALWQESAKSKPEGLYNDSVGKLPTNKGLFSHSELANA